MEEIAKLLFGTVGYLGIAYSGWCALMSVSAKSWPTANGIINSSGVDEEYEPDGSTYKPVIEYSYQVRGREYSSCKYAFGFLASNIKWESQRIVKRFPTKSAVKVYYSSKCPAKSVLLTGIQLFHVVQVIFFAAIIYFVHTKM